MGQTILAEKQSGGVSTPCNIPARSGVLGSHDGGYTASWLSCFSSLDVRTLTYKTSSTPLSLINSARQIIPAIESPPLQYLPESLKD